MTDACPRPVRSLLFLTLLVGSVVTAGCELIEDVVRDGANRPSGGPAAPVPPPTADAGAAGGNSGSMPGMGGGPPIATDPGPAKQLCASSSQCRPGTYCTTERGVCTSPPGCGGPNTACPAVCYGTCEPIDMRPLNCKADSDCRLSSRYCEGCQCQALSPSDPEPICHDKPMVACLVDPCRERKALCIRNRCTLTPPSAVPPAPPRRCLDTVLAGDETTCRSVGEWKDFAWQQCRMQGLELGDYSAGGGDCGPDRTRMVKYTCCTSQITMPPPPPPPLPPEPQACTSGSAGDETTCRSQSDWKLFAYETCLKQGGQLNDYAVGDDCGNGNSRRVKYVCCRPNPVPPPPSPSCVWAGESGSASCKTPEAWKTYAAERCRVTGAMLTNISIGDECGGGQYRSIKYECCGGKPVDLPLPPSPSPVCKADSDCPKIRAACKMCGNGSASCPTSTCVRGQCQVNWPACPA